MIFEKAARKRCTYSKGVVRGKEMGAEITPHHASHCSVALSSSRSHVLSIIDVWCFVRCSRITLFAIRRLESQIEYLDLWFAFLQSLKVSDVLQLLKNCSPQPSSQSG
jgi:hypothetical protein